ncbi:MAG: hypothetical protein FWD60_11095 [Candidatus Azobacteroides sp.]|nr:hypothetical protein [Candidatus Azobacteroides sp.]
MIDLQLYAELINIPILEIKRKTRLQELAMARFVYWFYLNSEGYGFGEIGRMFGWNHSSIIYGIRKIENLISVNDKYVKRYLKAIDYKQIKK